jgi:hypothetical protein
VCKGLKSGRHESRQVTVKSWSRGRSRSAPLRRPERPQLSAASAPGTANAISRSWSARGDRLPNPEVFEAFSPRRHHRYGDRTGIGTQLVPSYPWPTRTEPPAASNPMAAAPIPAGKLPLAEVQNAQSPTRLSPTSRRARTKVAGSNTLATAIAISPRQQASYCSPELHTSYYVPVTLVTLGNFLKAPTNSVRLR